MDKEELNNEEIENVDVQELTEEESEETTGGAAKQGNLQFTCACGLKFISEMKFAQHVAKMGHRSGIAYYQQVAGKLSQGKKCSNIQITGYKKDSKGGVDFVINYTTIGYKEPYGFSKGTY